MIVEREHTSVTELLSYISQTEVIFYAADISKTTAVSVQSTNQLRDTLVWNARHCYHHYVHLLCGYFAVIVLWHRYEI